MRALEDMTPGPRRSATWERVRWPDDEPLPAAGGEISITRVSDGQEVAQRCVVLEARPDFEPGWVQVEVVPV